MTKNDKLIPQPHGGALLAGGKPGNKGGGRPRDEIRRKFLSILSVKGLAILREILDAPREREHVCPKCGHSETIQPPKTDDVALKALDLAGKYGLGTYKEIEEHKSVVLIAPTPLA